MKANEDWEIIIPSWNGNWLFGPQADAKQKRFIRQLVAFSLHIFALLTSFLNVIWWDLDRHNRKSGVKRPNTITEHNRTLY